MSILVRRVAIMVAALMLGLSALVGVSSGVSFADPYDDDDGTVEVSPDPVPDDPQPEAPEPAQEIVEDPAPPAEEPEAPEPQAPEPQAPDDNSNTPDTNPGAAATGPDDSSTDDSPDVVDPDISQAAAEDITVAEVADPDIAEVAIADVATVAEMRTTIEQQLSTTTTQQITQWDSAWVQYDQYYRPLIVNPYRTPLQIAYTDDGNPRILTVPPLRRTVLDVPQTGVYSFTALAPGKSGGPANVSVGSFSGGGYVPKPGQPPPTKPANPQIYSNVLVHFDLGNVHYQPVVVKSVTDLGNDTKVGATKVLLDEETPAWGAWGQTTSGQRELTITLTQTLPGLSDPADAVPAGYKLTVAKRPAPLEAAAPASSGSSTALWISLAVGAAVLLAAVLVVVLVRKRRSNPTS